VYVCVWVCVLAKLAASIASWQQLNVSPATKRQTTQMSSFIPRPLPIVCCPLLTVRCPSSSFHCLLSAVHCPSRFSFGVCSGQRCWWPSLSGLQVLHCGLRGRIILFAGFFAYLFNDIYFPCETDKWTLTYELTYLIDIISPSAINSSLSHSLSLSLSVTAS